MSELRQRCEDWIMENFSERRSDGTVYICQIDALVSFAKEQQIKGMEAVKAILQAHHSRVWITEQIDAAIQQLKEGG